jgi:phosphatidylglycerophosphate synthase
MKISSLFKQRGESRKLYIFELVTILRLLLAPLLLVSLLGDQLLLFKILLAVSFVSDAMDGPLSKVFRIRDNEFCSRLDSVADQVTVFVLVVCFWIFDPVLFASKWIVISLLFNLYFIQTVAAVLAYGKITSFHTFFARASAIGLALFYFSLFFQLGYDGILFSIAAVLTAVDLMEEIMLIAVVPKSARHVRGLYWIKKKFYEPDSDDK